MGILEVPGARLYYEQTGKGPLMVLIPGGTGTAHIYQGLAQQLAAHLTVVTGYATQPAGLAVGALHALGRAGAS